MQTAKGFSILPCVDARCGHHGRSMPEIAMPSMSGFWEENEKKRLAEVVAKRGVKKHVRCSVRMDRMDASLRGTLSCLFS